MKSLHFESIALVSHQEKKARYFEFHRNCNLFLGENRTGKSTLLKALYWSMGAEPAVIHDAWKNADVLSCLKICVDDTSRYKVVRYGATVKIFDQDNKCLINTRHFTNELGPFLAELLDLSLKLNDRNGIAVTPPPAYLFLPFYIDQDRGWTAPWSSFSKLEQFAGWKSETLKFHTGIRSNDYYHAVSQLQEHRSKVDNLLKEQAALRLAFNRLNLRTQQLPLAFDRESYRTAVGQLMSDLNRIQKEKESQLRDLTSITNQRILLDQQVRLAYKALGELNKDIAFVEDVSEEEIVCPTCGTEHHNSLQNKFSLVETQEEYRDFILKSEATLAILVDRESVASKLLSSTTSSLLKIENSINEKRGTLKVADVLLSEGHRQARKILQDQLQDYVDEISKLDGLIAAEKRKIGKLEDKTRVTEIVDAFHASYEVYQKQLDVVMVQQKRDGTIPLTVNDTGSEQPRAVLAYNFAVLDSLNRYSSTGNFPIVIDSPLQQDQDATNTKIILKFISSQCSSNKQIFLGSVYKHGIEFGGKEFVLTDKNRLLQQDEYTAVSNSLSTYFA